MDSRGREFYIKAAAAAAAEAADADADAFSDDEELASELDHPNSESSQKKPDAAKGAAGSSDQQEMFCVDCGKSFSSDKAMYGHLRSHPLRTKRGMKIAAAAAGHVDDEDFVVGKKKPRNAAAAAPRRKELQLDGPHPGKSPVKGKRGRPATAASSSTTDSTAPILISSEQEAAMTLLDMASGRRLGKQPAASHVADVLPPPAKLPRMPIVEQDGNKFVAAAGDNEGQMMTREADQNPAAHEAPQVHVFGIVTEKLAPALQGHVAAAIAAGGGDQPPRMAAREAPMAPVRQLWPVATHQAALNALFAPPPAVAPPARRIPSPASDRVFSCPKCRKGFPSHQALGGHMASHRKAQKHQDAIASLLAAASRAAPAAHNHHHHHHHLAHHLHPIVAADLGDEYTAAVANGTLHKCEQCSLIFATGQALGGHKRKHYIEGKDLLQEANQAIASAFSPPLQISGNGSTSGLQAGQSSLNIFRPAPPAAATRNYFMSAPAPIEYNFMAAPPTDNTTAPVPPIADGAEPEQQQQGRNLFDLNEVPEEEGGN